MIFEQKETNTKKTKTYFWTILKWYWFIVPSILYIVILPRIVLTEGGPSFVNQDIFTMLFQFMNLLFSGLMFVTKPIERSKSGVADIFLKVAIIQQFVAQNIFGVILTALAWYQLPYKVTPEPTEAEDKGSFYFKPKTILYLAIANLIFAILAVVADKI